MTRLDVLATGHGRPSSSCLIDDESADTIADLKPRADELVVRKHYYDAFNGTVLDEPYLQGDPGVTGDQEFDVVVPADHLWVMGDNRGNSADSRVHLGDPGGGRIPSMTRIKWWINCSILVSTCSFAGSMTRGSCSWISPAGKRSNT